MFPLIGMPEGAEWLVILVIVILVFGAAKLPDLARGTGQALRIFKAETKGLRDDEKKDEKPTLTAEQIEPSQIERNVARHQHGERLRAGQLCWRFVIIGNARRPGW